MLPLTVKQHGGASGSISENSDSCSAPTNCTKKSVRFSSDALTDHQTAERSAWLAAQAAATGSTHERGKRSVAATVSGSSSQHGRAGGKGYSTGSGVTTADTHDDVDEDAVGAERHGLLPSWRLKMPVVKWCVPAFVMHMETS